MPTVKKSTAPKKKSVVRQAPVLKKVAQKKNATAKKNRRVLLLQFVTLTGRHRGEQSSENSRVNDLS